MPRIRSVNGRVVDRRYRKRPVTFQECGIRSTVAGPLLYVRVRSVDEKPLSWPELWRAFAERYPERWAIQMLPPADYLIDEINCYHLFIFDEDSKPIGLDMLNR